jgi:hypothetical protein
MSLYYFDLRNRDEFAPDEEGTELPSMDEVENEAAYALSDMLREAVRETDGNPIARDLMIEVREGGGSVLHARFHFEIKRLQ